MKQTKLIMGMPISVEILDKFVSEIDFLKVFALFSDIDDKFSTYKKESEISKFNNKELRENQLSQEVLHIISLSKVAKEKTNGYFNIYNDGKMDPSGIVKGYAILKAQKLLRSLNFQNFYINAGGDIVANGKNFHKLPWRVGIKNPFDQEKLIKILSISNLAVATSGLYIRGNHIYNPTNLNDYLDRVVSVTVVGKNIQDADVFATAAFAMQEKGIYFLEKLKGYEGYVVDKNGIATKTSQFEKYVYNQRVVANNYLS